LARFRLRTSDAEYPLAEGETLIGRAVECAIKLDNPLVSRRHARVVVRPEAVLFEDLGSTHGSRVNGEVVRGARPLLTGDRITIGITDLILADDATAPPVPSGSSEIELAALIGRLCQKGRIDDAERIGRTAYEGLKKRVAADEPLPQRALGDAIERAITLAEATRSGEWTRVVFDTAALLHYCFEDKQLDRIYGVLFVARPNCGESIDHYLRLMEPMEAQLNEKARYNLQRVAALRKLTTAPAAR
jgi:pSer/pThr/pTyr-binding forkhead associated (FHA) protein